MSTSFDFSSLVELCRHTHAAMQSRVGRVADTSLAASNWLLGWYIVEFEQQGADRAAYGTALLERLSAELGKGFSVRSLRQFRVFYLHRREIGQTTSVESTLLLHPLLKDPREIRQTMSAELFATLTCAF